MTLFRNKPVFIRAIHDMLQLINLMDIEADKKKRSFNNEDDIHVSSFRTPTWY